MQEMFRTLIGLSLFSGAILYLCPEGGVKRALKLLCTAILTAAVLSPVRAFDYDFLSAEETRFALAEAEISNRADRTKDSLNRLLVQKNCENYLVKQGQELGLQIQSAVIELSKNEEGQWQPYTATIEAAGSDAAAEQLCRLLSTELGIPTERQVWTLDG